MLEIHKKTSKIYIGKKKILQGIIITVKEILSQSK